MTAQTDDFIVGMRDGAEQSFEEFVRLYESNLLRVTYRILYDYGEAEDAVQETLIRAYQRIDTYNDDYRFATWLYRIATNVAIDRLRQRKRVYSLDVEHGLTSYETVNHFAETSTLPSEWIVQRERYEEVCGALLSLPEKYREPLLLKVRDELSLKEIGDRLNLSVGTIKTRIFRGRELLRKTLQSEHDKHDRSTGIR